MRIILSITLFAVAVYGAMKLGDYVANYNRKDQDPNDENDNYFLN